MKNKNKALEGLEQLTTEVGRTILQAPVNTLLNQVTTELGKAKPINILPARNVPLTETTITMAHNAYNSLSSGARWPNQQLSITELLDIGIRGLEFDTFWDHGEIRLCHQSCNLLFDYNRPLADALKEVQDWLVKNPSEAVILKFEDYLDPKTYGAPRGVLGKVLRNSLDDKLIFKPIELLNKYNDKWPSINELIAIKKQIILMPQNSGEDHTLYFGANWNSNFKNNFASGTIAKIRPSLNIIRRNTNKELIEVGEDRSFSGVLVDTLRKIPGMNYIIPNTVVAGQMTKEEIQQLPAHGVNIIAVDNVERSDSRLTNSTTIRDVLNNDMGGNLSTAYYIFMPLAIVALAYATPRDKNDKLVSTSVARSLIQLLVATTLPDAGRVLYHSVDGGISSYNASVEEATKVHNVMTKLQHINAFLVPASIKAVETVARLGLTNITAQSISSSSIVMATASTAINVVVSKIMTDPLIGVVSGMLGSKGAFAGFVEGIDSASFGFTNFAAKNQQQNIQQNAPNLNINNTQILNTQTTTSQQQITSEDQDDNKAQPRSRKKANKPSVSDESMTNSSFGQGTHRANELRRRKQNNINNPLQKF